MNLTIYKNRARGALFGTPIKPLIEVRYRARATSVTAKPSSQDFENRVIIVTPNFQQDQTALFIQTLLALRPTTSIYNHRIVTSMLFAECLFSPPIIIHSKTGGHITSISRFNNTNEPTYQHRHMTTFC